MSTNAQAVLDQIKNLPSADQDEICEEVLALKKLRQRAALERLAGSSEGLGLLDKLLADRARERARG